jgi:GGDEF domain-containing protein
LKYAKFQQTIILLLIVVIVGMSVAMLLQKTDKVEAVGHVLMLVVIAASLNWGYKGGLPAFAGCIILYAALRLSFQGDISTGAAWELIAAKFITYGALTLICCYMRNHLRYFFVKLEHHDFIDDETQIGNKRFLLKELTSRINENERYEVPFSLVAFTIDPQFLERTQGVKGTNILRDISTSILKNDTRSVDELARMDNRLVVILPCVRRDGADICCKRLEVKMKRYLESHLVNGELDQTLDSCIMEYPDDRVDIESMVNAIRVDVEGEGDKKPGGVMTSLRR